MLGAFAFNWQFCFFAKWLLPGKTVRTIAFHWRLIDNRAVSAGWIQHTKKNGLNLSWNGNMSCQVWGEMIYTPYRTLFFIIFMSSADKVGENPEFIYLLCLLTDRVHDISIWHHQSISFDALAFDGCKLSTGSKKRNRGLRDQVR